MRDPRDFQKDLAESQSDSQLPFWDEVYRKAFPEKAGLQINHDLSLQRRGVDRIVILQNGERVFVEEKVRYRPYPDILLERKSCVETNSPGWIERSGMRSDWLAYAVKPACTCYLIPFQQLQRGYHANIGEWSKTYPPRIASTSRGNGYYRTASIAIPRSVLFQAAVGVSAIIAVTFTPPSSLCLSVNDTWREVAGELVQGELSFATT